MGPTKTRVKVRKVCFACLKQFDILGKPDKCLQQQPLLRSRTLTPTVKHEDSETDVLVKFVSFIERYLGVTSAQYAFLNLIETSGKRKKKLNENEKLSAFCDACVTVICNICDLYHELCEVQLRLSSRLGELGELFEKAKMGVGPKSRKHTVLKRLAEQLCADEISMVDELRCVIASKCSSRRHEHSNVQVSPSSPQSQSTSEVGERNEFNEMDVKMEADDVNSYSDHEQLDNHWTDHDDDYSMLHEAAAAVGTGESFPVSPLDVKGESSTGSLNTVQDDILSSPAVAEGASIKTDNKSESEESEYCPTENGSSSEASEDDEVEDSPMKPTKKKEKCKKLETIIIPEIKPSRKRKYEPAPESEEPCCCHQCGGIFNTTSLLATHLNQKHETEKGDIKCSFCWMSFTFEQTYNAHLKLKHKRVNEPLEELFKCDSIECGLKFADLTGLNNHLMTHANTDKINYCSVCNHGFVSKSLMNYHELVHTRPVRGLITCPQCKKVVHGLQNFMDHYNFKHGEKLELYKCPKCERTLSSERVLNWHLKWHTKKDEGDPEAELKVIKCRTCGKKCKDKEELEAHEELQHPRKVCSECGAKFKNKELLRRHTTLEHTTRKYTCSICSEVFHFIKRYDKHMQNVHNVIGFQCEICNKSFTFRHSLNAHMKVLHAEKKETHLCQQCGDTFNSAGYLREHIARKHQIPGNDGRHACPYCGLRFLRIFQVQKHMSQCEKNPHPGRDSTGGIGSQLPTQSVICDQCGRAFTSAGMLRVHARRVHT